jgi:hypothetical protein
MDDMAERGIMSYLTTASSYKNRVATLNRLTYTERRSQRAQKSCVQIYLPNQNDHWPLYHCPFSPTRLTYKRGPYLPWYGVIRTTILPFGRECLAHGEFSGSRMLRRNVEMTVTDKDDVRKTNRVEESFLTRFRCS